MAEIRILFLVSRDWQVRRNEIIIEDMSQRIENLKFIYLSEEKWSRGNASRALRNPSASKFLVLPRSQPSTQSIWNVELNETEVREAHDATQAFLDQNLSHNGGDIRYVLFFDGLGSLIEGFPSQLIANWLRDKDCRYVLLQHGYLGNPVNQFVQALKRGILLRSGRLGHLITHTEARMTANFVYGPMAKSLSWLMGSKLSRIHVVGNLNTMAVHQAKSLPRENVTTYSDDLVIFSPGSYRLADPRAAHEFENFVQSVQQSTLARNRVCIKFKSGERDMLPDKTRKQFESLGIVFLSDDLTPDQIETGAIIACSATSNVGLELLLQDRDFFVYGRRHAESAISRIYRRFGIARYNAAKGGLVAPRTKKKMSLSIFDKGRFLHELESRIIEFQSS